MHRDRMPLLSFQLFSNLRLSFATLFPRLTTVGENLGIAAFVLSLLALIINLAILLWLTAQRPGDTLTISNTAAKGKEHHRAFPCGLLSKSSVDDFCVLVFLKVSPNMKSLQSKSLQGKNIHLCPLCWFAI